MPEEIEVSTVIGHIYEASYRPSFWPKALESIAKFTHSSSAALMYQDNELESVGDAYTYNVSAEASAKHQDYGQDPNFRIMSESVPLGKAATIDHIIKESAQGSIFEVGVNSQAELTKVLLSGPFVLNR